MSRTRRTMLKLVGTAGVAGVLPTTGADAGRDGDVVADGFDADGGSQQALIVLESRSQFAQLDAFGFEYHAFEVLPVAYARLAPDQVAAVADLVGVRRVAPNRELEFYNDDTRAFTGADAVRAEYGYTGDGVHAAVIDSGFDGTHPDFEGRIRHNYRFTDPLSTETVWVDVGTVDTDESGHGTHCAGTLGGDGAASDGAYAGMAPGVELTAYAVTPTFLQTVAAWDHLVANHPDVAVVSNSYGLSTGADYDPNEPINVATLAGFEAGVLPVFAAGNEGPDSQTLNDYAKAPYVVAVAAVDGDGDMTEFSSRGRAPGDGAFEGANYDREAALENLAALRDPDAADVLDTYQASGVAPPSTVNGTGVRYVAGPFSVPDVDAGGYRIDLTLTWTPSSGEGTREPSELELQVEDADGNTVAATSKTPVNSFDMRTDAERRLVAVVEPGEYDVYVSPRRGGGEWEITGEIQAVDDTVSPVGLYRPAVGAPGVMLLSTMNPAHPYQGMAAATVGGSVDAQVEQADEPYYAHLSGTSMACPAVAGLSALVVEAHRDEHGEAPAPLELIEILEGTAERDPGAGHDVYTIGAGVVDGFAAVEAAVDAGDEPVALDPIEDRTVRAGETVTIDVQARPAGDDIAIDVSGAPDGATFTDHGDGSATFRWETHPADRGGSPYVVTFTASDGETSDSEDVEIRVEPPRGNPNRESGLAAR